MGVKRVERPNNHKEKFPTSAVVGLFIDGRDLYDDFEVSVRGAVFREALGESSAAVAPTGSSTGASAEDRIIALEQKVKQLEAEIEALKRGRRNR